MILAIGLVALALVGFMVSTLTQKQQLVGTKSKAAVPALCSLNINIASTTTTTPTPTRGTSTPTPTPPICNKIVDVALVIDRSSTMNTRESDGRKKLDWAKEAAKTFVNVIKSSNTKNVRISVASFGAQGNDGTGILGSNFNSKLHTGLTSDYTAVLAALDSVKYVEVGTCIQCGIRIGNTSLVDPARLRFSILLSDGLANKNWNGTGWISTTNNPTVNVINEANAGRAKGITYFTIGYGLKPNAIRESTLIAIAGSAANYQYKPNATDWASGFLNLIPNVCIR